MNESYGKNGVSYEMIESYGKNGITYEIRHLDMREKKRKYVLVIYGKEGMQ